MVSGFWRNKLTMFGAHCPVIPLHQLAESKVIMYCKNCGSQLPDEANFCLKCGYQINGSQVAVKWETQVLEVDHDCVVRVNGKRATPWSPFKFFFQEGVELNKYLQDAFLEGWEITTNSVTGPKYNKSGIITMKRKT